MGKYVGGGEVLLYFSFAVGDYLLFYVLCSVVVFYLSSFFVDFSVAQATPYDSSGASFFSL